MRVTIPAQAVAVAEAPGLATALGAGHAPGEVAREGGLRPFAAETLPRSLSETPLTP